MGSRSVWHLTLLVLFCASMGATEFAVIGIEPELSATYGVGLDAVGLLISWFAIAYAVMTPILTLSTGRFKRYTVLVAYVLVLVVGNFIAMVAPSFGMLLGSRVVIGAVSGGGLALAVTYIPELLPQKYVPMGISVLYAAYSVAMIVVTSVGRIVATTLDWRLLMAGVFVFAVVTGLAVVVFLPRTGATDEPAAVREQLPLFRRPRVVLGMLTFVFGVGGAYVFYAYITPYLEDVLLLSSAQSSMVLMVYGCLCAVSNLLAGVIDMRWGFKSCIVCFIVQVVALLGLWAAGGNAVAGLAFVALIALNMYTFPTPIVSMFLGQARKHCPKGLTLASSLDPMSFNAGIAFGTYVGGAVVAGAGSQWVGVVGAAISAVAVGLVAVSLRVEQHEEG